MPLNSLWSKEKAWNKGATYTGPKPGDFPVGSMESRAAARAVVEHAKLHKYELSQEDKDALTLYHLVPLLTSGMSPSYPELEETPAYKRGKEVHERLHGPVTPGFPEPSASTSASTSFKMRFMREPVPGDVLRYQDVFFCDLMCYDHFITAWHRQIPELSCPLKIENDHMFFHQNPKYNGGREWSGPDERALRDWRCVEREANDGNYVPVKDDALAIPAVFFLGIVDGEHKCRPATASEIQRQRTDIFFPETQEEQVNG
jgi:hypothetical protein